MTSRSVYLCVCSFSCPISSLSLLSLYLSVCLSVCLHFSSHISLSYLSLSSLSYLSVCVFAFLSVSFVLLSLFYRSSICLFACLSFSLSITCSWVKIDWHSAPFNVPSEEHGTRIDITLYLYKTCKILNLWSFVAKCCNKLRFKTLQNKYCKTI